MREILQEDHKKTTVALIVIVKKPLQMIDTVYNTFNFYYYNYFILFIDAGNKKLLNEHHICQGLGRE